MVSENGSIKTAGVSNAAALWLYRKKLKIISIVLLAAGGVGILAYIALGTALAIKYDDAPKWVDAFLIFAVPFALGLIGLVTILRLKSREKKENRISEFTFFGDCFFYSSKSALEPSETYEKFNYSDAVLKRENEKYGYIYIIGKTVLPFGKENLEISELNAIRKNFGLSVSDDIAQLKNYETNEEQNIK